MRSVDGGSGSELFKPEVLDGKVCVVSGAGTGIGRGIAHEYARLGATVVVCGRRRDLLEQTVDEIRAFDGVAHPMSVDIRDESEVVSLTETVLSRFERVDILVNNAGGQFYAPAERITPNGFRSVVDLNLHGTFLMTHVVATRAFIPQRRGRVISITTSPHSGLPGAMHSGAARAGVENLTRTLSLEWGRFGVTLCAIAVSGVQTDVWSKYPPDAVANLARETSVGRLARPEELALLAAYLATDAAEFITGAVINFDGGRDNGWPVDHELPTEQRT